MATPFAKTKKRNAGGSGLPDREIQGRRFFLSPPIPSYTAQPLFVVLVRPGQQAAAFPSCLRHGKKILSAFGRWWADLVHDKKPIKQEGDYLDRQAFLARKSNETRGTNDKVFGFLLFQIPCSIWNLKQESYPPIAAGFKRKTPLKSKP